MNHLTTFRFLFSLEVWQPVIDGTTVTYAKLKDEKAHVTRSGTGGVTLVCADPIAIGSVVRNLRDRDGTPLQSVADSTYDLHVHTSEPELDPFSRVVGWRHALKRTAPRDFMADVARALGG